MFEPSIAVLLGVVELWHGSQRKVVISPEAESSYLLRESEFSNSREFIFEIANGANFVVSALRPDWCSTEPGRVKN